MSRAKRKQRKLDRSFKEKFTDERKPEPIVPQTENQRIYFQNLKNMMVNISLGSSGVGKTFCPSAMAADLYREHKIEKIIVARPYVQTGRSSGAKPGSSLEKLRPYVRSMLDTMRKRMGDGPFSVALRDGQSGDIEVCEIESIRGRSFDENSWLIIDEAQQTTKDEMIAIITRISDNCRLTVCGDPHQKDIRGESGLEWLLKFVRRHNLDVGVVEFTSDDIVRGDFVKSVVKGLERDGEFN